MMKGEFEKSRERVVVSTFMIELGQLKTRISLAIEI